MPAVVNNLDQLPNVGLAPGITAPTALQVLRRKSDNSAWEAADPSGGSGAVTSVAGRTGAVVLAESDVAGLVADLATLTAGVAASLSKAGGTLSGDVNFGGHNITGLGSITLVTEGEIVAPTYLYVNSPLLNLSGNLLVAGTINGITLGTAAAANTGASSGNVPVLDGSGKLAASTIPAVAINNVYSAASQAAMLALSADVGDVAVRSDLVPIETFQLSALPASTLGNWIAIGVIATSTTSVAEGTNKYYTDARASAAAPVQSVAGRTGAVVLTSADVGLGSVTNNAQLTAAQTGAASGVAGLDADSRLATANIPGPLTDLTAQFFGAVV